MVTSDENDEFVHGNKWWKWWVCAW